jgi:hypothetical protein
VLWNTVYLGRALDAVRRRGDSVPDELLAHLAPLGWQHINGFFYAKVRKATWAVLTAQAQDIHAGGERIHS